MVIEDPSAEAETGRIQNTASMESPPPALRTAASPADSASCGDTGWLPNAPDTTLLLSFQTFWPACAPPPTFSTCSSKPAAVRAQPFWPSMEAAAVKRSAVEKPCSQNDGVLTVGAGAAAREGWLSTPESHAETQSAAQTRNERP